MAGDGNDDGGGVAARPGPRGSVERKEGVEAEPLGEGGPVAVVMASGGDGLPSVRRTEEGGRVFGEERGSSEGGRGARGHEASSWRR